MCGFAGILDTRANTRKREADAFPGPLLWEQAITKLGL